MTMEGNPTYIYSELAGRTGGKNWREKMAGRKMAGKNIEGRNRRKKNGSFNTYTFNRRNMTLF
jgi:hypothetical protein